MMLWPCMRRPGAYHSGGPCIPQALFAEDFVAAFTIATADPDVWSDQA